MLNLPIFRILIIFSLVGCSQMANQNGRHKELPEFNKMSGVATPLLIENLSLKTSIGPCETHMDFSAGEINVFGWTKNDKGVIQKTCQYFEKQDLPVLKRMFWKGLHLSEQHKSFKISVKEPELKGRQSVFDQWLKEFKFSNSVPQYSQISDVLVDEVVVRPQLGVPKECGLRYSFRRGSFHTIRKLPADTCDPYSEKNGPMTTQILVGFQKLHNSSKLHSTLSMGYHRDVVEQWRSFLEKSEEWRQQKEAMKTRPVWDTSEYATVEKLLMQSQVFSRIIKVYEDAGLKFKKIDVEKVSYPGDGKTPIPLMTHLLFE